MNLPRLTQFKGGLYNFTARRANGRSGYSMKSGSCKSLRLFLLLTAMTTIITATDSDVNGQEHSRSGSFLTTGVQKTVLPNGLTLITRELHDKPIVATIIWYRVGSRNEELGQTGKSHFLEHMLFKGTNIYKRGDIDLITLKNGGSNNAFTWLDFTAYYFTFASDRWNAALEIESNRMRNTTFAEEEFAPEKQVVEEELRIGLDGPWEALENEVWATAFRQHPYHWPTVGWLQDLEAATAADMKAYYDKWYHPQNATLVIVGDFETAKVVESVKKMFGSIPAGPVVKPLHIKEPPQKGEKRVLVKKATPVERLLIGYHSVAIGDADSYPLQVVEALLSTGKASRLYQRLVEKDQSVTTAKANFDDHMDEPLFTVQAEVKPGNKLEDVEKAIYEEIGKLQNQEVNGAELEKAKSQIEADLVLSNEEYLQQAVLIGQYETIAVGERVPVDSKGFRYLDSVVQRIKAVTPADVRRVAQKYFGRDNRTVGYLVNDRDGASLGSDTLQPGLETHSDLADRKPQQLVAKAAYRTGNQNSGIREDFRVQGSSLSSGEKSKNELAGTPFEPQGAARVSRNPSLEVERLSLPNGLTVLLSENHSTPSVSISAAVRAGSRYETDDKAGLASMVGELIDEGTSTRTSQQIAEAVESVGGRLNSFGDYQTSGTRAAFLSKDVSLGLEITADLLMNASFPQDKVSQNIDRRLAQLKSRRDVPRVQASDEFNEIIFKGSPQHKPSVGYESTVRMLTRQDLVSFYTKYYVPQNTILAIVGDIDKVAIKKRIEEIFGKWKAAGEFKAPDVPAPRKQDKAIQKFVTAPKEQVNIFVGHVGIDRKNPDYYGLLVFDTILGSSPGFTSRIPRILRDEQGLAYSTFSNITGSAGIDPGRFVAYIGTSPDNLDKAIGGLKREISRIVQEPVTPEELDSAKAYLTGSFVFDFQTNAQTADFLLEAEIFSLGFDYLQKYPELIRRVTIDDVSRIVKKYIDPERLTTVVVGPIDEQGRLIKATAN